MQYSEHALNLSQREPPVADTDIRRLFELGHVISKERCTYIIVTLAAPRCKIISENKCIGLVNQQIFVFFKSSIEKGPGEQFAISNYILEIVIVESFNPDIG